MNLDQKTQLVWNQAEPCGCIDKDCCLNHKLCGICSTPIILQDYQKPTKTSIYGWNLDYIVPVAVGGVDAVDNLQAVHLRCNRSQENLD